MTNTDYIIQRSGASCIKEAYLLFINNIKSLPDIVKVRHILLLCTYLIYISAIGTSVALWFEVSSTVGALNHCTHTIPTVHQDTDLMP